MVEVVRRAFLAFAYCAALAFPARAAPPTTPDGWRAAAATDLAAIHDLLRDNAPAMVVDRDSAHFRRRLDEGLRQARASLPQVRDGRGYYFAVEGYVAGFRDGHIVFETNRGSGVSLRPLAWPGFVLGLRGGHYEVAFRAPDATDAPPLGARLAGCDGKDASALVAAHDRYDGNLQLAAARDVAAPGLLLDRGNPFIARPGACDFRVGGVRRTWRMRWRALDKAGADRIAAATGAPAPGKLGVEPWGPLRWWITVPSQDQDQDWNGFFASIAAHVPAIRAADAIVIDVRGDDGGSGAFSDRLARMLWGEAFVQARKPRLGPTVWRASKFNRDNWAATVETIDKSSEFSSDIKVLARNILARYDDALARGAPTFELADDDPPSRVPPGPDLVRGRVVVLTDSACSSACLDLMDEFRAMPKVVQAGAPTSADTIFTEMVVVRELPAGLSAFGYGQKGWIRRPRGSNVAYAPSPGLTWTGDKRDEAGLRAWLDRKLSADQARR